MSSVDRNSWKSGFVHGTTSPPEMVWPSPSSESTTTSPVPPQSGHTLSLDSSASSLNSSFSSNMWVIIWLINIEFDLISTQSVYMRTHIYASLFFIRLVDSLFVKLYLRQFFYVFDYAIKTSSSSVCFEPLSSFAWNADNDWIIFHIRTVYMYMHIKSKPVDNTWREMGIW